MRNRSLILASVLILLAVLAGAAWQQGWLGAATAPQQATAPAPGGRPPTPVEVAESKTQTLTDTISAIGSLVANETAEVSSDSAGRILTIAAVDGAAVKQGDELFRLDGALMDAEVKDAEARLALAEATFRRSQTLARSQNVAQSQVEQTRAELEQARSATDLAREKQRRLVVRAPFDGKLGFRLVSEGAYVTAGTPLIRLDQITTLKVNLSLPERFFTAVAVGQEVTLTADAVPGKTFRAKVTVINPVVDANGRALQVQAALDNSDQQLRPGMLVRAEVLGPSRQAVTVAEAAVVPQANGSAVFTVKDGKAVRNTVTTGQRRDGWVEITSGLDAGLQVITAGNARLAEGAPVKPVGKAAAQ
jgi:membrane fusion protein, multidrug efflux system